MQSSPFHSADTVISQLVFKQLKLDDESNQTCFDCNGPHTQYASVPNGIFICGTCADLHRQKLASKKLSQIKSISMDAWTDDQMILMAVGGNEKMRQHLQKYDLMGEGSKDIEGRFRSRAAEHYRVLLRAKCEGIPFDVQEMTYEFARELIPDSELKVNEYDIPHELQNAYDPFAYPGVNDLTQVMNQAQDYFSYAAQQAYDKSNEYNISEKVKGAQDYVYESAQGIGSRVYENAEYAKESAQGIGSRVYENAEYVRENARETDLYKKAGENAQYAADSFYTYGNQAYNSASGYMSQGQSTMDKLQYVDPSTAMAAASMANQIKKETH